MTNRPPGRASSHRARPVGLRRSRPDAFRVYAMLVIIVGHSEILLGVSRVDTIQAWQLGLNIVSRAAVPLFLLLAGEHLGPRLARDRAPGAAPSYVRHLAILYAAACLFYWITDFAKLARSRGLGAGFSAFLERQAADPLALLMHGPRQHLWFLVVLMAVVVAAGVVLPRVRVRWFVLGTAVLYGIGLALGPYRAALDSAGHDWWLHLLLQAPLFFAIGLVFGLDREGRWRPSTGLALIAVGLIVHALEVWWISEAYGTWPFGLAMLIGTVLYGTGVGMLALTPGASRFERWVGRFARYVPLVYLCHVFFIEILRPRRGQFPEVLVRVALPILAIACSFAGAAIVARLWARVRRRQRGARGPAEPMTI
jgi:surface polysaccharide O-acyltransferase-like enzyme